MKKWQLKKLSTGEALNEPQDLPDNWKNIFGLKGSLDRLGDLSWAGHNDLGWFEIEEPEPVFDQKQFVDNQVTRLLSASASMVAIDNTNMTKQKRVEWLDYRRQLQEVHLQAEYPDVVFWPTRPE